MKLKIATISLVIMAILISAGILTATGGDGVNHGNEQTIPKETAQQILVRVFQENQDKFQIAVDYLLKKHVEHTGSNDFEVDKKTGKVRYTYVTDNKWNTEEITEQELKEAIIILVEHYGFYISKHRQEINFSSNNFAQNSSISYFYKPKTERLYMEKHLGGNWYYHEIMGV